MKPIMPPALTALLSGTAMWGFDRMYHPDWAVFVCSTWIYRLLFCLGIAIGVLALIQFIRHHTTVDPHNVQRAKALITSGVYGISRNPMYLALVICLVGFALKLGNAFTLLAIPLFVIYMNHFQIKPEEEALEKNFGDKYNAYKAGVRRWL